MLRPRRRPSYTFNPSSSQSFSALLLFLLLAPTSFITPAHAVTVWYQDGQHPLQATTTSSAGAANYTGAAAYNPTTLNPPAPPGAAAFPTTFVLGMAGNTPPGASITQMGGFFGFSVEMSVANQVLGKNSSFLQVPFLNLMANIQQRAGRVVVRVGGNTQETAVLVDSTPDGRILEKDMRGISNPTQTPPLIFTPELLHMLRAISSLVNVRWHLGVPFNDTQNFRLGIVEQGQQILGDYLIGLQVGNEPDLYVDHGHRPQGYGPYDYYGEFGLLVEALSGNSNVPNKNILIGPNVNSGNWSPEQVWNTGFVDTFSSNLGYLAVEHYPTDNCFAQFGVGTPRDPQTMFPTFLNHTAGQNIVAPYLNSTAYAQSKGKRLLMFETNSASCGGFVGISDSFGAALWALDYAMQLAYANFSGAYFHVGGQNVYYNPFTSPPTNQSTFRQWTVGPVYYSALVMAEAIGASNNSQVLDLAANNNNIFSPAYAIYEGGNLARVLLFNYVSDPTGASDISVALSLASGGSMPGQIQVKHLLAKSVSQKGNFTWAGQTFGANFESDGRLQGGESIQTVPCTAGTCTVRVHAPGAALVFLSSAGSMDTAGGPTQTFPTTARTKTKNTLTMDPRVLATSNGHGGPSEVHPLGSTSEGRQVLVNGAVGRWGGILTPLPETLGVCIAFLGMVVGVVVLAIGV
ncbi:hypothetical protein D9619_009103 [Psilocybe cf. subviscida]|uniref:Beta-glucuronidase C-terminal domain-containing protein n=1 Tax=Psilocybe cf. subviscida TaxID=2480587 RepID=A0A8H5FAG4_9AGAR|nr:hypothetical protein D9619_009103 [Psilocybe cf. subviscida]